MEAAVEGGGGFWPFGGCSFKVAQWRLVFPFFSGKGSPLSSSNQQRMLLFSHGHWASEVLHLGLGVDHLASHLGAGGRGNGMNCTIRIPSLVGLKGHRLRR